MPSDRQPPARFDRANPDHQPHNKRMPSGFEPRLILPEPAPTDDLGDLDLPDDLAALAEQLQDDAAHLSTCYSSAAVGATAGLPGSVVRGATAGLPSSAPMRLALRTTAAASIAIALSIGLFAGRQQIVEQAIQPQQPAATDSSAEHPTNRQPAEEQRPDIESLAHESLEQTESLLLLGEASGPEREGLLDLLQQSASTETSISF